MLVPAVQTTTKSTLADWTVDDDDVNGFYTAEKRQRGGRKKRKKNKDEPVAQDWDDLYDPTRPNNYEEYKQSDERIREIKEWKDLLYSHRMARRRSSDQSSDDAQPTRPINGKISLTSLEYLLLTGCSFAAQFAPPPSYNFAPPPSFEPSSEPTDMSSGRLSKDESGEDAFTRRMRLSQMQQAPPPPPPTSSVAAGTISRAPVRYNFPAAPAEIPASEEELEQALQNGDDDDGGEPMETDEQAPRSNRPGQKGFAERLMAKYGWTKGSGLGASGDGITTALKVKVEKVKKGPNAEKGGPSGGRGKIIGGKRKGAEEEGKFGAMSEVVLLKGMVDGLDLDVEMGSEGTLVQEIGEECGEKYGRVERVFVHRGSSEGSIPVFIQFTSQLSALRVKIFTIHTSLQYH
jgi:splicing factor 45